MPQPLRGIRPRTEPPPGVSPLQRLLAFEGIRQLADRYAVAVGAHAFEALAELFVDDVEAEHGQYGREALRASFEQKVAADEVTLLYTSSHVIDLVSADLANGIVYCYCESGTQKSWLRQFVVYEDVYRRVGDRWYFAARRHELFYGVDADTSPLSQEPASWPQRTGRGNIPFGWPTWGTRRS